MNGLGEAEESVCLIDEMRAEIEQCASTLGDTHIGLPVGRGICAVAVEVSVEFHDTTQGSIFNKLLDGQKIRVPTAVLVHADEFPRLLGYLNELLRLS